MSEGEVAQFDQELNKDTVLHLTPEQRSKAESLLKKYIDIDKHHSIF